MSEAQKAVFRSIGEELAAMSTEGDGYKRACIHSAMLVLEEIEARWISNDEDRQRKVLTPTAAHRERK